MARPPADVELVAGLETLCLAVLLEDGQLSACNAHPVSDGGAHVHRLQHFAREVVDPFTRTDPGAARRTDGEFLRPYRDRQRDIAIEASGSGAATECRGD